MRDSIFYSALRALAVAFCVIVGLTLGIVFITSLLGLLGGSTADNKLTTVNTEEILPNASGKREVLSSEAPVILQININGVIGTESLDTKTIRQQLVESREGTFKDNRVKGILLYIDTPGGTVTDADGIFHELLAYKQKYQVPIYAYIDGLCASGGMYVALAADKIFASDVSLVGSVGVIAPAFFNLTKLLDKVGIEALTIFAGKDKDALNPVRPWKPGEDDNYRHIVEYYYNHFVNLVTTYRPEITKEQLTKEYGAHVFPAPLALEHGFIDVSGVALSDALRALLTEVGIDSDYYQVLRLENKSWWNSLFTSQATSLFKGKVKHEISLSPELDIRTKNKFLYLYAP